MRAATGMAINNSFSKNPGLIFRVRIDPSKYL